MTSPGQRSVSECGGLSDPYKIVPRDKLIGGHYAVTDGAGRLIGESWRLDRSCAQQLAGELNRAFQLGQAALKE